MNLPKKQQNSSFQKEISWDLYRVHADFLEKKLELFPLQYFAVQEENKDLKFWYLQYLFRAFRLGYLCLFIDSPFQRPLWTSVWPIESFELNYWDSSELLSEWLDLASYLESDQFFASIDAKNLEKAFKSEFLDKFIIDNQRVFIPSIYKVHSEVISFIKKVTSLEKDPYLDSSESFTHSLNQEQCWAVENSLDWSFFILTGGPGTGKTYTLGKIIEKMISKNKDVKIALCAPTGKACQRIEENGQFLIDQIDIMTLHRLLKMSPFQSRTFHAEHPLAYHLIVVDEASMMDIELTYRLFSALDFKTKLILIGDPQQLPPVESCGYFHDLVLLFQDKFPLQICSLKKNIRAESTVLSLSAQFILEGRTNEFIDYCYGQDHAQIIAKEFLSQKLDFKDILSRFSYQTIEEAFLSEKNFKILSAYKSGPMGVNTINQGLLQEALHLDGELFLPIMITRNQKYTKECTLVNGQMAIIHLPKNRPKKISVEYLSKQTLYVQLPGSHELYRCQLALIESWDWGFALTIHKSQGSEYRCPMIIFDERSKFFDASLLYTAWTRAKEKVELWANKKDISAILQKKNKTTLDLRLDFTADQL